MDRMIFVNLPVTDLQATRRFYTGVGFQINETYSGEDCVCVVISPTIYVMALDRSRFADFVSTHIADPHRTTQVLNCISASSRQEVDAFVAAALASGGAKHTYPVQQEEMQGPEGEEMYGSAVRDPDGHIWEVLYMPPAAG